MDFEMCGEFLLFLWMEDILTDAEYYRAEKRFNKKMADRKTENSSEKPNNFDKDTNVRSKDEPQINASQHVQHVESVETMSCQECRRWIYDDRWGWFCPLKGQDECKYEPKTEPQTETVQGTGDCEHCSRLFIDCDGR